MTKFRWLLLVMLGLFACAGTQETASPTQTLAPLVPTETATVASTPERAPVGEPLHGYLNVAYTQADGDKIGKTQKAQFLNVYATW